MESITKYFLILNLCFIGFSCEHSPSCLPSKGLIAYYPFNGNATDSSGNGNHGTVVGAKLATDRFGNTKHAYNFNGIDNYIEITNKLFNLGWCEYTISGWFCPDEINNQQASQSIFQSIPHIGLGIGLNHPYHRGHVSYFISSNQGASWDKERYGSFNNYRNNIWYHVILLKHCNTYKLYINGKLDDTYTSPSLIKNFLVGYLFGFSGAGVPNECFKGKLDDFRIFDRTLTVTEIQQLYHEGGWNK